MMGRVMISYQGDLMTSLQSNFSTTVSQDFGPSSFTFSRLFIMNLIRVKIPVYVSVVARLDGHASVSVSGDGTAILDTTMSGVLDETLTYDSSGWSVMSQTTAPTFEVSPTLNAAVEADPAISLTPNVTVTFNGLYEHSGSVSLALRTDIGSELIPDLHVVSQVSPHALLQPSKFHIERHEECSSVGKILVPFVDDLEIHRAQSCVNETLLFNLPSLSLLTNHTDNCSQFDVIATEEGGENDAFLTSSFQWFSYEDQEVHLGPASSLEWPYTLLSEKADIYTSGHGRLGEGARRFYKTQLNSRLSTTYYIDEFQQDGIYVEGISEIDVCEALERSPGFSDDEWDLMGVVDHKCYFAYDGVPDTDHDVFISIRAKNECT